MLRGLLCVAILMCVLCIGVAQPAKLSEDALLQRRITVWLKMEPMRDALRQIGKQTGVALRCQDAIAEEKVAIFVEDRPAHEILTQLAKLFRYEWRKNDNDGYTLYVPDETRLQEEKIANLAREARRKAIQELIQAARAVRKMSLEQRRKELDALYERRESLTPAQSVLLTVLRAMTPVPVVRRTADGEQVETGELMTSFSLVLYCCLASLPDRAVQALLDGQTIGFSTKPPSGVFLFPDDALLPSWMRDMKIVVQNVDKEEIFSDSQFARRNPEFTGMWLRLATRLNAIEFQALSLNTVQSEYADQTHTQSSLRSYEYGAVFSVEPYLGESELWRYWQAWATPQKELLERFPERVEQRKDKPAPKRPQYRHSDTPTSSMATPADVLEQIAWATRRPVISDAFRLVAVYLDSSSLVTPRSTLRQLDRHCWLRADELGYLLARHRHYWAYRRYEFPEAWLRPLEQKHEQQSWLSLDDYIALAGKLTDFQVDYLTQGRHFLSMPLVRFELEPLVACLPALRFLASLNTAQRQQLAAGNWLSWRRLNTIQQRRFREAIGDRFPPAQQLFREPLPEAEIEFPLERLQNLVRTTWAYSEFIRSEDTEQSSPAEPTEPGVRLRAEPETLRAFVLGSHGYASMFIYDDSSLQYQRDYILRELESDPGSRLMAARLRSTLIEFVTERGERKAYRFVLSRFEPYTLPEPKPEKGEP
jgi:hypothetical protein